jgi:8-oxo-dGTP pyrophosphatase MutT (NUDIX family)
MTGQDSIPAATLVLYRERDGDAEHLFLERSAKMAFAAGALVFPGGRVDPDDYALAARYPAFDPADAAARIAAMRETLEEAGIIVGLAADLPERAIRTARQALVEGSLFSNWLDTNGHVLNLAALTPWARWLPNHPESRVFDTRFYIAALPEHAHPASVDATENVQLFWATAAEAMARSDAGTVQIIFPTMRNLERLAAVPRHADAVAHARAFPVRAITPHYQEREDGRYLCIPTDAGYPVTAQIMTEVKRAAYPPRNG